MSNTKLLGFTLFLMVAFANVGAAQPIQLASGDPSMIPPPICVPHKSSSTQSVTKTKTKKANSSSVKTTTTISDGHPQNP